jgi:hypoxanthine phosphoribosyltransferase
MSQPQKKAIDYLQASEVIFDNDEINASVKRLAAEISADMSEDFPLCITLLRGALIFAGQLLPHLHFPLTLDTMDVGRYGDHTYGSKVTIRSPPITAVNGRHILLIDDILDVGITLEAVRQWFLAQGALSVKIVVLTDKDNGLSKPLRADFVGLIVPNRFVFGYGMDIQGYWRNLPAIYALKGD